MILVSVNTSRPAFNGEGRRRRMGAGPAARGMRDCRTIESLASRLAGASAERAPGDRGMGLAGGLWRCALWSQALHAHVHVHVHVTCWYMTCTRTCYMYMLHVGT